MRSIDAVTLRRRIGYVFQGIGLFPHMTVAENIAITPKLLDWDEARMTARVDELLELVRLDRAEASRPLPGRSFPAAKASASASPAPSPPSRRSC